MKILKVKLIQLSLLLALALLPGCGNLSNSTDVWAPSSAYQILPNDSSQRDSLPEHRTENFKCPGVPNVTPAYGDPQSQYGFESYTVCKNVVASQGTHLWIKTHGTIAVNQGRLCVYAINQGLIQTSWVPTPSSPQVPQHFCTNVTNGEAFLDFPTNPNFLNWNAVMITNGENESAITACLLNGGRNCSGNYSFGNF